MLQMWSKRARLAGAGTLLVLGLLSGAQARDSLSVSVSVSAPGAVWSVGHAPVVVVPAPVVVPAAVTVPVRAVLVAPALVAQVPSRAHVPLDDPAPHRGRGWHRKPGRHAEGRSHFWQYEAPPPAGTAVVVQTAPQVWIR